jgi:hypothetical protein
MITAIVIGLLVLISCIAAAGLIASAGNKADMATTMAGLEIDPDARL